MVSKLSFDRDRNGHHQTANQIYRRISEVLKTKNVNKSRFLWELIQNSRDSAVRSKKNVDIEIFLNEKEFIYSHNGGYFSEADISGLIDQVSSKDLESNKDIHLTGRFGTGFLTTHLLSRVVTVKSVLEKNGEYFNFEITIDRRGNDRSEVLQNIDRTWKEVEELFSDPKKIKITKRKAAKIKTEFIYHLEDEFNKSAILTEILRFIPYVFVNCPQIATLSTHVTGEPFFIAENRPAKLISENVFLKDVCFYNCIDKIEEFSRLVYKVKEDLKVFLPISAIDQDDSSVKYKIDSLDDTPRLFCTFPLLGSQSFPFPCVVDCSYFYPKTERTGVWLGDSDDKETKANKAMIEKATILYAELLDYMSESSGNQFVGYYNAVDFRTPKDDSGTLDLVWYREVIYESLIKALCDKQVALATNGNFYPVSANQYEPIIIPFSDKKTEREMLWRETEVLFDEYLVDFTEMEEWLKCLPLRDKRIDFNRLDLETFVLNLSKKYKHISDLMDTKSLSEEEGFKWLNGFVGYLRDGNYDLLMSSRLFPNYGGNLGRKEFLYIDVVKDDGISEVTKDFGYSYIRSCLHPLFDHTGLTFESYNWSRVVSSIRDDIDNKDDKYEIKRKTGIRSLCSWFDENPELGQEHFRELYTERDKLFMDTIENRPALYSVMKSGVDLEVLAEIANAEVDLSKFRKFSELDFSPRELDKLLRLKGSLKNLLNEESEETKSVSEDLGGLKIESTESFTPLTPIQNGITGENIMFSIFSKYFEVARVVSGCDYVILGKDNQEHYIEVKVVKRGNPVQVSFLQTKKAVQLSSFYTLCVIEHDGTTLNENYVLNNSFFKRDFGEYMKPVFDASKHSLEELKGSNKLNKEIDVVVRENDGVAFSISSNYWSTGKSFFDFLNTLKGSGEVLHLANSLLGGEDSLK